MIIYILSGVPKDNTISAQFLGAVTITCGEYHRLANQIRYASRVEKQKQRQKRHENTLFQFSISITMRVRQLQLKCTQRTCYACYLNWTELDWTELTERSHHPMAMAMSDV